MDNIHNIFTKNNFNLTKKTSKAEEFKNKDTSEVIYLVPNKEINIILNPNIVEKKAILRSDDILHSTALTLFPKEQNKGANLIQYGYSFKFKTEDELDSFLGSFNRI